MSNEVEISKKPKTEITLIKMEDGREVGFAGKRKVSKETLIDESKIITEGDTITLQEGAVSVRMDFRNGSTRTFPIRLSLFPRYAGHGGEQKFGDELAVSADKPMSEEDMVLAVEDLHQQVNVEGNWYAVREGGGGFAGASVVVRALVEASGKTIEAVKVFLQGKLDAAKAKNEKLSRKDLYDSFRNPNSKVGQIIKRMEDERLAATSKVDADSALAELGSTG